jgi:hypothetical protein
MYVVICVKPKLLGSIIRLAGGRLPEVDVI